MAIDLNNLDISLYNFNAVSGGTYNIGQLKLGADGKSVHRVNNRKTLTIFNRTEIKPEEALAVKLAFCTALEKEGGLSAGDIGWVKKKLDIPETGMKTFSALRAGSIRPLTAADVRDVIDKYARTINGKRTTNGLDALRTTSDIYAGVSRETMTSRTATRNKINDRTFEKNRVGMANKTFNTLLDLLEYSRKDESGPTQNQKAAAREILTKLNYGAFTGKGDFAGESMSLGLLRDLTLSLNADGKISARITLDDGKTMTLDTGLTRNELYDKMAYIVYPPQAESTEPVKARPARGARTDESALTDLDMLTDLQTSLPDGNDGTEIYEAVNTAFGKLKNGKDKEMLYNLAKRYSLVKNENLFNMYVDSKVQKEMEKPRYQRDKQRIEEDAEKSDDKDLKHAMLVNLKAQVRTAIASSVRSDQIEMSLGPLLISLGNARGQDERNYKLMKEVRELFDPPKKENAGVSGNKKLLKLIDEITFALTGQHLGNDEKIKSAKSEKEKSGQVAEDNLEENLNIDKILNIDKDMSIEENLNIDAWLNSK